MARDPEPRSEAAQHDAERPEPGLTLSEEELAVTTRLVESGRVRLVKRIEVETVTQTVELRREVLEVERLGPGQASTEPLEGSSADLLLDGILASGSLQEGAVEIVLMQEEATISTRLVPRERVRLSKTVVREDRPIEAEILSEHADVEEGPPGPSRQTGRGV
jgi:stress response protein YsnF